jgi:5-methylcytosine-specific restriction endonuclease McrA
MSRPPTINVNVNGNGNITINGDVDGGVRMCRSNDDKPARNKDSRCHRCASPGRYGAAGGVRSNQAKKYRRACAERIARGVCEFCNRHAERLEVDHINGTHADDRPENFQVLCVPCHREKGRLQGDYTKRNRGN